MRRFSMNKFFEEALRDYPLRDGAEGSSTRVREPLRYISAEERLQEARSRGWANDPTPNPLDPRYPKRNARPPMRKGKVPKCKDPNNYEDTGVVHRIADIDPYEYPKPRSFRGKSTSDPKRLYS
jgi:hypothetical protein